LLADPDALPAKSAVNARAAVPLAALRVRRRDLDSELRIRLRPFAARPLLPVVVAAAGDLQDLAKNGDRIVRLLRVDELEHHPFSFAKKAAAFFKISRSISRRLTRLRSSRNSSRSPLLNTSGEAWPVSSSARFTHSRSAVSVRSRSLATSVMLRSPAR